MKLRSFTKIFTCLFVFAVVAGLDYITGYEISSFALYLLPIMLAFFYFGKFGGYLAVLAATVIWYGNDVLTGHVYNVEATRYWNTATRLLIYGLFVYGLSTYAKTIATHRRRLEDLQRIIPMCHGCGRVWWEDGTWKTPAEVLEAMENTGHLNECPCCQPNPPPATSSAA